MSNEEKVKRLERLVAEKTSAAKDLKFVFAAEGSVAEFTADAAVLREAAQLMRERGNKSLLTERDWKAMYEAQERDLAALRKELEGLRQESRIAELEAERDAARAGEARAVEALKRIGEKARWILLDQCVKRGHDPRSVVSDWSLNVDDYLRDEIEGIVFTLDAQPALDWLAQREREAAADCIESRRLAQRFEERLNPSPSVEYAVTEVLAAEAAALRAGKEARGEK